MSFDISNAIVQDDSGNIYYADQFSDSVDFDAGSGSYNLFTSTIDG